MMSGLLKMVDLDTHSKLGSLPTNRVLYEIDSYEWLSIYPKQLNHIENRFKILFRDLYDTGPLPNVDTSKWTLSDIPNSNGYKTILSTYFLLQEKIIIDPFSISYSKRPINDPQTYLEPGRLRHTLLPYLPNQKVKIAVFNIKDYLPSKYEIDFDTIVNLGYYAKQLHTNENEQCFGIYRHAVNQDYLNKCRQQNIQINVKKKGIYINDQLFIKIKAGRYILNAPKLYEEIND